MLGQFFALKTNRRIFWIRFWSAVALLLFAALPYLISEFKIYAVTELLILMIFVAAFYLVYGIGGMVSFGHSAFYGLGAYIVAVLMVKYEWGWMSSMGIAILGGALLALFVGLFAVRLTTVYLSMLTLACSQMLFYFIARAYNLTNGDQGLSGIEIPEWWAQTSHFYFLVLGIVVAVIYFVFRIENSPFGLVLKGIRDNRKRAPYVGVSIAKSQLIAFVISGAISGMAGALHAFYQKGADISMVGLSKSIDPVIASLLGGTGNIVGTMIGTVVYRSIQGVSSAFVPQYWPFYMGLVLIFVVSYWPRGIIGMLQDPRWLKWLWRVLIVATKITNEVIWFFRNRFSKPNGK